MVNGNQYANTAIARLRFPSVKFPLPEAERSRRTVCKNCRKRPISAAKRQLM